MLLADWDTAVPANVHLNTGDKEQPFRKQPTHSITWPTDSAKKRKRGPENLVRETIATGDWNDDGKDDVFLAIGQSNEIHIVPGSVNGLENTKRQIIPLDYSLHHETGLFVADFNGDGNPDIATLGYTKTGVGSSGPLAVYIWCQR